MSHPSKKQDFPESQVPGDEYPIALAVCGCLLLAIAMVFGRTVGFGFVNYDDKDYVYKNPHLTLGLTTAGVAWALTTDQTGNWHPLTWLSHLWDYHFYGLTAGGYHATNVVLHAATAIVLFLVLWRMTGRLWPSAIVAGLFAIHPLRVESVAWIAERKDVLSGLCFVLTLAAYLGYVRHPFSLLRYLMVVLLFALGLMAKPMLVTLPFVLLLLDYWPLGRFGGDCPNFRGHRGAVVVGEKGTVPSALQERQCNCRPNEYSGGWSLKNFRCWLSRPPRASSLSGLSATLS